MTSMWNRMKSWGVKTWAAVAAAVAFVIGILVKLFLDRNEAQSAATVTAAATRKTDGEFVDATAAAGAVAGAVATEAAVKTEVAAAIAAGPVGSDPQLQAIDNTVSEMSRKRHEEALARAGKR